MLDSCPRSLYLNLNKIALNNFVDLRVSVKEMAHARITGREVVFVLPRAEKRIEHLNVCISPLTAISTISYACSKIDIQVSTN